MVHIKKKKKKERKPILSLCFSVPINFDHDHLTTITTQGPDLLQF